MTTQTHRPRTQRQIQKRHRRERQVLAEAILKEGAAQAAQAAAQVAAALAVERASLTEDELKDWQRDMEQRLQQIHEHPEQNLGFIEEAVARGSREPLRLWDKIQELAAHSDGPATGPFTLVIEIDAWNIRERDNWGRTQEAREEARRQNKEAPSKWHWVYVATVFRLDHRGETAGGRPVISQRRYVSTRLGIEDLMRQLYRQAIDCGLGQARDVLVIADGATWIWNAVKDRFPDARCRLDLYHADEHLWTIAHELYGKDTPEARQWVEPLLKQLHQDKPANVIHSLKEITGQLKDKLQEKVQAQITYFENNTNRTNYRAILAARTAVKKGKATAEQKIKAAEPLGSGAIESTCRQYQCRFKRTGQFWSLEGDEALMCLETFWRNNHWHDLFPHAKPPPFANN